MPAEDGFMSYRVPKVSYWQDAPMPRGQLVLFASTLEERIPLDHPVRLLDEILDELDWTKWEAVYVGKRGQPPIHPSILCKVLLFALSRRIRSSRQIEYAVEHSIDFIWLASGRKLDHSTLSEFRRKHEKELKDIYRQMIQLAISMGVAKLSELCIDGTKIRADASRFKTYKREKVSKLIEVLDGQIADALSKLETNDALEDLFDDGQKADQLPSEIKDLEDRRAKLEAALAELTKMEEQRRQDGIDNAKSPAQLPTSDTDSRILPNKEGGYAPNYTPMAVTETENGFIVGNHVLIGNVEHICMMEMVDAIEADYQSHTETILADGAYATGPNLEQAEARGTELLSPVRLEIAKTDNPAYREDLSKPVSEADIPRLPINATTKRFDRSAFVYDAEKDTYHCPAGKVLKREGTIEKVVVAGVAAERKNYRCNDCVGCPLASLCRMKEDAKTGRKVGHDEFQEVRERQAERMQDASVKERYKKRQHYGETQFAFIKSNLGVRRFLLRGHIGVIQEWRWSCLTFNIKKLMQMWLKVRTQLAMEASTASC
jgi:transposase